MKIILLLIFFICVQVVFAQQKEKELSCQTEKFMIFPHKNGKKIAIQEWEESKSFFFFEAGMAIDADGSPRAYHLQNIGLDNLSSAGYEGNWWALATNNGEKTGKPIIQNEKDPAPGYFVSMTSLNNPNYPISSPLRYIDAEKIPYFVLNPKIMEATGAKIGDFGYIYNEKTNKGCYAIFADVGSNEKLGEASICAAKLLDIPADARKGGQTEGILYIIFPFSGNQKGRSLKEIEEVTKQKMEKASAFEFIEKCWKKRSKTITNSKKLNSNTIKPNRIPKRNNNPFEEVIQNEDEETINLGEVKKEEE